VGGGDWVEIIARPVKQVARSLPEQLIDLPHKLP
jgi:hypothetical protein